MIIAFFGILASRASRSAYPDAIASMLIGILLLVVAYFLIRERKELLIGEGVGPRIQREMRAGECDGVEEILELLTLQTGPHGVLVLIDARFREDLTTLETVDVIRNMDQSLRARFPDAKRVFIESQRVTDPAEKTTK